MGLAGTSNLPETFHVKGVAFICILLCIPFAFRPSAGPDPALASSHPHLALASSAPIKYYGAFSTRRLQDWDNPGPGPRHVRCLAPIYRPSYSQAPFPSVPTLLPAPTS